MDFDDLVKKPGIFLHGRQLSDDDLGVLTEVLRKSAVLEELELGNNRITLAADSGREFVDALANSPTIKKISLRRNKIGDEGAKRLADVLARSDTVQVIDLWGNSIGGKGAKSLADALAFNNSLLGISLFGNNIGDEGAESLGAALVFNSVLQKMDLRSQGMGLDPISSLEHDRMGLGGFVNGLGNATFLSRSRNARKMAISIDGAQRLANALQHNDAMNSVQLAGNDVDEEQMDDVAAILRNSEERQDRSYEKGPWVNLVKSLLSKKDEENERLKEALAHKDAQLSFLRNQLGKAREVLMQDAPEPTNKRPRSEIVSPVASSHIKREGDVYGYETD